MYSENVNYGRNADEELDDYVRCSRCGFYCRLSRDARAVEGSRAGWGITNVSYNACSTDYNDPTENYECGSEDYDRVIEYDENSSSYDSGRNDWSDLGYDGIDKTIYDPIVVQGCPQCGCLLYNK